MLSPSDLAITRLAQMFPHTSAAEDTIEKHKSQHAKMPKPSIGIPILSKTGNSRAVIFSGMSKLAMLIKMTEKTKISCSGSERLIPYAWAIYIAAELKKTVVPLKLKTPDTGSDRNEIFDETPASDFILFDTSGSVRQEDCPESVMKTVLEKTFIA